MILTFKTSKILKGKDGSDKPNYNHSAPTSITFNLLDIRISPTHNVTIK